MVSNAELLYGLTPVQYEILQAIRRLALGNGHPPCMREVLVEVRLNSTSALSYQYRELSAKGFLRWKARQPRTVEVRLPGEPAFSPEGDGAGIVSTNIRETLDQVPGTGSDKVVWVPIVGRIS